jgi:hypothetical protein
VAEPLPPPPPATAIAARRCNAMATADETRTVCRSKTAFCLRFGGRGLHGRGLLESGSAHARAHTSPHVPLFSVVMVCRREERCRLAIGFLRGRRRVF